MANEKKLFKRSIGIFKGFIESGHEFVAEIVTPYHAEFVPLLGSFMFVRVTENAALLGRVTQFYPVGAMAGAEAEEYLAQLQKRNTQVPEDVKELKLRYNVKMRLLGTVELRENAFRFCPGVRTLPHLGAAVGELTEEALDFVCNARLQEEEGIVPIGYYSLGDHMFREHPVKFGFSRLQSKRTLVFARAGYGKSNLIKLLVAKLYEQEQKIGMIIFDPEGEYAFKDVQDRPGLADLPHIADKLVVFTDRRPPDDKYNPFIAGSVKLNLKGIRAATIVRTCLPEDRLDRVWAVRLMGLGQEEWANLVDELDKKGYKTDHKNIENKFKVNDGAAVIRNITPVIRRLHDPSSDLPHSLFYYLAKGCIVIVDISLLSSEQGQQISGLILSEVFKHNVRHFQEAVIPVIAVIEEAQNVLSSEKMQQEDSPFVRWAKEGRKYNLGCILVTQQPGAISDQLLSQADNFFVMHLVSGVDLDALKRSNAHFSDDILSYILNEPIEGNTYFWSAPAQPYVVSARLFEFKDYVKEKVDKAGLESEAAGKAVNEFKSIKGHLSQLVREVIATDKTVPVYTPVRRDNTIIDGQGAVNLMNVALRVAERFLENHRELKIWMFPQLFYERDRKPALQRDYITSLGIGKVVNGRRQDQDQNSDYILIQLSNIEFRDKGLDSRKVVLEESQNSIGESQDSSEDEFS